MKQKRLRYALGAAALSVALAGGNVQLATADDDRGPRPRIAPSHTEPEGQTYGRWAAEWWQWALGVPAAANPLFDTTGTNCAQRQLDDVWFLAGSFGSDPIVRTCEVLAGKSLFFPLINNFYGAFLNDPPETRTEEAVRDIAKCSEPAQISLRIDGVRIPQSLVTFTGRRGIESPLFNIQLPPGAVFDLDQLAPEAVLSPSAEQGYYVFLYPLRPGSHTIEWDATGCTAGGEQHIRYNLNVVNGGHH